MILNGQFIEVNEKLSSKPCNRLPELKKWRIYTLNKVILYVYIYICMYIIVFIVYIYIYFDTYCIRLGMFHEIYPTRTGRV
jgi:hypothetical protein